MSESIILSIEDAQNMDDVDIIRDETEKRIKTCNSIYFENRSLKHINFIFNLSGEVMNMSDSDIASILGIKNNKQGGES